MNLIIDPKNCYTIDDILNDVINAQSLYFSGNFSEAYPIIVKAAERVDFFAGIGLKGPNLDKVQYKAVYMLAGDICGELGKFDEAL